MMQYRSVILFIGIWLTLGATTSAQGRSNAQVASDAREILKTACYRCHGEDGTVDGGFSYVLDGQQLVTRKQVIPNSAQKSKLMRRILNNEMPPEGEGARLTKEQIAILSKWIDSGAKDFNPAKAPRKFLSAGDVVKIMVDDLKKRPDPDRKFTRYLVLTHLYNAGRSTEELQGFQHGITKLINSLSWGRKVVIPTALGTPPTVLRIDIRDYKWTTAVWERLADADPYAMTFSNNPDAKELYRDTECEIPSVRGDWFVAAAARPPLYHVILQLPSTEFELEKLLHVDAEDNIRSNQIKRAGFNGSAVSRNNRMIERHESSYGYYWKSYDFAKNTNRQNLFSHPLGPGDSEHLFKHDGGELIFSLPNGFQGYLLVDGKGHRIDKGPTEIVSDPKQPDRAVENGLSCMSCHIRGMLPKDDQVRAHVLANPGAFAKKEIETVLALYPEKDQFQALIQEDTEKFRKATEQAGMPQAVSEPIKALAMIFEAELDLQLAAAEAQLKTEEFEALLKKTPSLARILGTLQTPGGTVQRDVFASSFAALARAARVGVPRTKTLSTAAAATSAKVNSPASIPKVATSPKVAVEPTHSDAWFDLGGRNKFPPFFQPNESTASDKNGLSTKGRNYILSRSGNFLVKDFKFELVFTMKPGGGEGIMFLGLGEADRNSAYNEPKNSVYLRIHPPDLDKGAVALSNVPSSNVMGVGSMPRPGTHRAVIEKTGDAVTLSIDVDNDGPSDDDFENTIPDLKEFGKYLNGKNTFIFFGGGGTYQKLRLTFGTPPPGEGMPEATTASEPPVAAATQPELKDGPAGKHVVLGKGRVLPPPWSSKGAFKSEKGGGLRVTSNQLVISKDGAYLKKDFTYEVVLTLKEGDPIALVGIGNITNASPPNLNECVCMRIHPPKLANGEVLTSAKGATVDKTCQLSRPGTHLFRISKKGATVTFTVDADNDGPSDDDGEFTIPDIKEFAPYLHDKNAYLFFGNGGLYKSTSVTIER